MAKKTENKKADDEKIRALRVEHEERREELAEVKKARAKQRQAPPRRETVDVLCAFCDGTGKDPFGIMSKLSTCQVCAGKGYKQLHPPTAPCPFCRGTGVHPGSHLTCTTCGGVGTVEVPVNGVPCSDCDGTGLTSDYRRWPQPRVACARCHGIGVLGPKSESRRKIGAAKAEKKEARHKKIEDKRRREKKAHADKIEGLRVEHKSRRQKSAPDRQEGRPEADLKARPVAELRDLCAELGLTKSGKKAELIDRIRSAKAA